MENTHTQFRHDLSRLKAELHNRNCTTTLVAIEYAYPYHFGHYRKDGVTPDFSHQVHVAYSLLKNARDLIRAGLDVDQTCTLAILHDTPEENPEITPPQLASEFGEDTTTLCFQLNKNGKTENEYFSGISDRAWPVKLADRDQNVKTVRHLKPNRRAIYHPESRRLIAAAEKALRNHPELRPLLHRYAASIEESLSVRPESS